MLSEQGAEQYVCGSGPGKAGSRQDGSVVAMQHRGRVDLEPGQDALGQGGFGAGNFWSRERAHTDANDGAQNWMQRQVVGRD